MPQAKILISYIAAAAFWDILRHVLKEIILNLSTFAKLKKDILFRVMQTLLNIIESKISENLPLCIQDIFIT